TCRPAAADHGTADENGPLRRPVFLYPCATTTKPRKRRNPWRRGTDNVLLIFCVSGFCGLIYESVWAHYVKLMLGHAAYAQTLVLSVFIGGLALGSWLCARIAERIRNPLLGYAIIEGAIGFFALIFHGLFLRAMDWGFDQ